MIQKRIFYAITTRLYKQLILVENIEENKGHKYTITDSILPELNNSTSGQQKKQALIDTEVQDRKCKSQQSTYI